MLQLWSQHDLEGIFVHLVQPNVVAAHVWLRHHSLLNLIAPEGEDQNAIPQTAVYINQIVRSKLLTGLLLLGCSG